MGAKMKICSSFALIVLLAFSHPSAADRQRCHCTGVAGSSSADTGECKAHETKKPSCHLSWYDLADTSDVVVQYYEDRRAELESVQLPALGSSVFDGFGVFEQHASDTFRQFVEDNGVEAQSFHFALGYLAFTEPEAYETEPLAQSLLLLMSSSAHFEAGEDGVWALTKLIDAHAETIRNRMSGDGSAGDPGTLSAPSGGVVIDYSARGCADFRFNDAEGFNTLSAVLIKTRFAELEAERC